MENESSNYSFTPIVEDNSVEDLKNDFFGGNDTPSTPSEEVPPILENVNVESNETNEPANPASEVVEITNNEVAAPAETSPATDNNEPVEINIPKGLDDEETSSENQAAPTPASET